MNEVNTIKSVYIKFSTINAAFDDDPTAEIANILRNLAIHIVAGTVEQGDEIPIRDRNGNTIGEVSML